MSRTIMLTLLVALATGMPVEAKTIFVATNGADGFICGTKDSPCRSIGVAILTADEKDTIQVGPGLYGDLNDNGVLEGLSLPFSGEEFVRDACDCMVLVDKRLTIASEKGAGVTILDAGGTVHDVVKMEADDALFGKKNKGFTITGQASGATPPSGLRAVAGTSGIRVGGNRAVVINQAGGPIAPVGFLVEGTGHRFEDNIASGSSGGTLVGVGFWVLSGSDHQLRRNVVTFVSDGFLTPGLPDLELRDNVAVANFSGIGIGGGGSVTVQGNSLLANYEFGLLLLGSDVDVLKNNFFGNQHPPAGNCGLDNSSGTTVTASKDFWGAASGPGADPADLACASLGGGATVIDSPASKPNAIKATVGR